MGHLQRKEKQIITGLNTNDPQACTAFGQVVAFFEIYDALKHSNHCKTLLEIYLSRHSFEKGNVALMFATHLADNTFYTHRRMYLQCYELMISGNYAWQTVAITRVPKTQ